MDTNGPKLPVTVRLSNSFIEKLRAKAREEKRTVSALVSEAVERFLGGELHEAPADFFITQEEWKALIPIVEAFGLSIPASLLFRLVEALRQGKQ